MKSIAFYNNKGGVGKTTSVINIAYQLAADKKVLVVDLDGQANCSRFFVNEPKAGLEMALTEEVVTPTIALSPTRYPNIDIITATPALNDIVSIFYALPAETQRKNAEKIITATDKPWCNKKYDYVLVDLPPALNKITESIISVCDYVFVPIELSTFAIQGIPTVTNIIADCGAKFGGCFVNKFDRENPADIALMEMLKDSLGTKALNSYIPFSRVVKNSISFKTTAPEYMGWTYAAECCANLAKEIIGICG
ncbi:MAG: ParA family protein [Oscillospiraceae bacterium]